MVIRIPCNIFHSPLPVGYGLVEIPRGIWRNANVAARVRYCSHRLGKAEEAADQAARVGGGERGARRVCVGEKQKDESASE